MSSKCQANVKQTKQIVFKAFHAFSSDYYSMLPHVSFEVFEQAGSRPHALIYTTKVLARLLMLHNCMSVTIFQITVFAVHWTSMAAVDVFDVVATLSLQLPTVSADIVHHTQLLHL